MSSLSRCVPGTDGPFENRQRNFQTRTKICSPFWRNFKVLLEECNKRKYSTKIYPVHLMRGKWTITRQPTRICRPLQVEGLNCSGQHCGPAIHGHCILEVASPASALAGGADAEDDDDQATETTTDEVDFCQWGVSTMEGVEAIPWKKPVVDSKTKFQPHNHISSLTAKRLMECKKVTPASHGDLFEVLCSNLIWTPAAAAVEAGTSRGAALRLHCWTWTLVRHCTWYVLQRTFLYMVEQLLLWDVQALVVLLDCYVHASLRLEETVADGVWHVSIKWF